MYSDLPKVINETDKDIMDKIATHSYHSFAVYFKWVTIGKYKQWVSEWLSLTAFLEQRTGKI